MIRAIVCWVIWHKWSWREEGEMLRRWLAIGVTMDHECRRCEKSWAEYQSQ